MTPANYQQEYFSIRVMTASPTELIRILYEAGIQAVDQAIAALHAGDIRGRGRQVTKAVEIIGELKGSLRSSGEQAKYANTLGDLYGYMQSQLIQAHSKQSEKLLLEVSRLLNTLLEGWSGATKGQTTPHGEEPELVGAASEGNPYFPQSSSNSGPRSWQL